MDLFIKYLKRKAKNINRKFEIFMQFFHSNNRIEKLFEIFIKKNNILMFLVFIDNEVEMSLLKAKKKKIKTKY